MKFAVNVEFTDEELRKYAEDVGRRWTQNAIHEVIRHAGSFKIDPSVASAVAQTFAGAFSKPERPHFPPDPGPIATGAPDASPLERCRGFDSINSGMHEDGGWMCCHCSYYNSDVRPGCRNCKHDRCDVIVTPPPKTPSTPEPESSTPA